MYCENCGHRIPEDAKFCPNCGHNVNNDFSSKISNFKNKWNQSSGSKKAFSILAICLIGFILLNSISIVKLMSEVDEPNNDYEDNSNSNVYYDDVDDDTYNTNIEEDNPTSTVSSESSDSSSGYSESQESYSGSESGGSYVGSVNSNKFHYPSCGQASKIKSGNLITFSSREDAVSSGYVPCKFCNP